LFFFWLRRIAWLWFFIALIIFLMQLAIAAIVHDNESVRSFLQFLEMLPPIVKTALGGESLAVGNTSALIAIGYQHPLVLLLFLLFAVSIPAQLLAGEVERGTMELLLCRHVTKIQVYLCVLALTFSGLAALVGIMFLGTCLSSLLYDFGNPIDLGLFFRLAVNGGFLAMTAGAIGLFSAGVFPTRNGAIGFAVAFLIINYFLHLVAQWWPPMKFLEPITLFHYLGGSTIMVGWPLRNLGMLLLILTTCAGIGGYAWNRRDLRF